MTSSDMEHTSLFIAEHLKKSNDNSKETENNSEEPKSFYSQCCNDSICVESQFDDKFKSISVNQCSWAAAIFISNAKILSDLYLQLHLNFFVSFLLIHTHTHTHIPKKTMKQNLILLKGKDRGI